MAKSAASGRRPPKGFRYPVAIETGKVLRLVTHEHDAHMPGACRRDGFADDGTGVGVDEERCHRTIMTRGLQGWV